jgi:predicted nucleic acid-binding protein
MAWCYPDDRTPGSEAVRQGVGLRGGIVPGQWPTAVHNSLRVAERRGRVTAADVAVFIEFVRDVPVELDVRGLSTFGDLLVLSRQHSITPYDAAYLELALRRGLPLATRDANMARAAKALGMVLLDTD